MPKIRLATEEDIPHIVRLYDQLTIHFSEMEKGLSGSPADYRKVFDEISADARHELFVIEDGGEVAGTVALLTVPNLSHKGTPWAMVENLVVDPKSKRRSLGRLLLEHCIARARKKGCHRIELCSDKRREEAHRLYRSVGFEPLAYGFRIYF
ncbi:MAG: GNAT family N-acetyltransferase [Dehalococcoidia bacterium]|nr:GNAT family N-acetyltransferase [Dehalococcoidia bacterium]